MFRNQYVLPENDIAYLNSVDDCEKCGIELDSLGRPLHAQPVDQFDSKPFMMGENGFRRSDIAILINAESDDLKRSIAARLTEIQSSCPDQSLTDSQLADLAIPRYAQGGSAFRDWYSSLDKSGIAKLVDSFLESKKPKPDTKIDFSEPQVTE